LNLGELKFLEISEKGYRRSREIFSYLDLLYLGKIDWINLDINTLKYNERYIVINLLYIYVRRKLLSGNGKLLFD
jgi:hypothetical protein